MSLADPEPYPSLLPEAPRVVLDTNIFARREWMEPIVESAKAGRVVLLWSPSIIAEAGRVLQWICLSQYRGPLTEAVKRATFNLARRWFNLMTTIFHVVEDRPPHERLWTDTLRDEHDRQIWIVAVRSRAHIVVTDNLRDGPPLDDDGLRIWENTVFVHPDTFIRLLAWWPRSSEHSPAGGETLPPSPEGTGGNRANAVSSRILKFLRSINDTAPRTPWTPDAEE